MKQCVALLMIRVLRSFSVVGLFIVSYSNAMEIIKQDPSIPCDDICYLNQMPRDILDYIASFLMETEEEFIARTQTKKEETEDCAKFLVNYGFHSAHTALCPDETKAVFFVRKRGLYSGHKINVDNIIIIDRQKDNDNDKVIYQQKIDNIDKYDHIALSRSGSMIAALYIEKEYDFGRGERWYYAYEIQKVDTQKKRARCVSFTFTPASIFFNKQGTHLIVHGTKDSTGKKPHHIISLKNVDQNKPQAIPETINKLQTYLKDKFVCHTYIEGKK